VTTDVSRGVLESLRTRRGGELSAAAGGQWAVTRPAGSLHGGEWAASSGSFDHDARHPQRGPARGRGPIIAYRQPAPVTSRMRWAPTLPSNIGTAAVDNAAAPTGCPQGRQDKAGDRADKRWQGLRCGTFGWRRAPHPNISWPRNFARGSGTCSTRAATKYGGRKWG